MRLNMGCGFNHIDGFVNVDREHECSPDLVWDLESFPWPWETNSVEEVRFTHSLEHLGQYTDCFKGIMKELYRVCRDGALVIVEAPWPLHIEYLSDPTHVRPLTPSLFGTMDKSVTDEWERKRWAGTPLSRYWQVDFRITNNEMWADEKTREFIAFKTTLQVVKEQ